MLRRFHVVWLSRLRGRAGRACVDRLLADDMKQFAIALTCGLGLAYTVAFAMSWGWQKRNQQRIEALHLEEQHNSRSRPIHLRPVHLRRNGPWWWESSHW